MLKSEGADGLHAREATSHIDKQSFQGATLLPGSARSIITRDFQAIAIFTAIALLFYWKTLISGQFSFLTGYEPVNQAYCWFHMVAASLKSGNLPLWDPYSFSGRSFPGEMQTAAFYPLNILLALVPFNRHGFFSPQFYHVIYAGTHVLCAYFFFKLLTYYNRSFGAAVIGAICFSFGGVIGGLEGWPHLLHTAIWLPLITLLALKSAGARTLLSSAAWGSMAGMVFGVSILAGGLHFAMMEPIVFGPLLIYESFRRFGTAEKPVLRQRFIATGIALTMTLLIGICVAAVQLLPSMEYSRLALRFGKHGALLATEKIPYRFLSTGLNPNALLGLILSAPAVSIVTGEYLNPYVSVMGFALAMIGAWKWRSVPVVRYCSLQSIASFLYAMGGYSLLHGLAYVAVPFLWMAREPSRFVYIADFGLAILAGFGVDALRGESEDSGWQPMTVVLKWVAAGTVLAMLIPAIFGRLEPSPWVGFSLLMILFTCAMLWWLLKHGCGSWRQAAIAALILFDLSAFNWGPKNKALESEHRTNEMDTLLNASGAAGFLKSQPGLFRVAVDKQPTPNIGQLYQLYTTFGSGVTLNIDYDRVREKHDLMNVRYVMRPANAQDPNPVYEDPYWKVYRRTERLAPAWLVHRISTYDFDHQIAPMLNDPTFDSRHVAIVSAKDANQMKPLSGNSAHDEVNILRYEPRTIELKVRADSQSLLVLSETYYPGWTASVNGVPAAILKVDGGLRGIEVASGTSSVVFHYDPWSFQLGATVAWAAVLISAGLAVANLYARRRLRADC